LFDNFRAWYEAEPAPRLLDLGTGTGAMLRRVLEFRTAGDALLSGLDSGPMSLESAAGRIRSQLESAGLQVRVRRTPGRWELEAEGRGRRLGVRLVRGDLLDADPAMLSGLGSHDLVTAHAFLDLLPVERGLRTIRSLLRPGGLLYATLNYDGLTVLLPAVNITTSNLPGGTVDVAYNQTLTASGGNGTYTWTKSSGTLPARRVSSSARAICSVTPWCPCGCTETSRA
jgi:SAM-dependent methyltransferase